MQIHPETPVTLVAAYTLAGAPGKFQAGTDKWSSSNPKDVLGTPVSDADAGTTQVSLDGSANSTGDTSIGHVTADVDRGKGDKELAGDSEQIEWTDAVDIVADGVTVSINMA
jgi:hypothetical protein